MVPSGGSGTYEQWVPLSVMASTFMCAMREEKGSFLFLSSGGREKRRASRMTWNVDVAVQLSSWTKLIPFIEVEGLIWTL